MTRLKAALLAGLISIALIGGCGRQADEAVSDPQPDAAAEEESAPEPEEIPVTEEPEPEAEAAPEEEPSDAETEPVLTLTEADDDGTLCDGFTVQYNGQEYLMSTTEGGYVLRNTANGRFLSLDFAEVPVQSASVETLLTRVAEIYRVAHNTPYVYGDSQTAIPCEDGIISCDRLIARALWDIESMDGYSFRDQQRGGMTIFTEDEYLTTHGFHRVWDVSALQRGDIILYLDEANGELHHTCILTAYNKNTGLCARYDAGITDGVPKFTRDEPIVESVLYNYDYVKSIVNVYRLDSVGEAYTDNQLAAKEKDEADPAELSQRWVMAEMIGNSVVLRPALYDYPGTFGEPDSEEQLLFIEVEKES